MSRERKEREKEADNGDVLDTGLSIPGSRCLNQRAEEANPYPTAWG